MGNKDGFTQGSQRCNFTSKETANYDELFHDKKGIYTVQIDSTYVSYHKGVQKYYTLASLERGSGLQISEFKVD